jgi:hypothetical protein
VGTRGLLIALVGLASLHPAAALAQSPAPRPTALAVSRLMTGESFEATMNQMIRITTPAMRAMVEGQLKRRLTAAEERGLVAAFQRSFNQVYPRSLFEEEGALALTRHLTDEELAELLRFYESPVGAKMLALQPTLLAESERVFRSRQQQFTEHLRGELAREFPR